MSSNTAFTFINPPEDVKIFELEVNHSGGTLSFPGNVRWMGGNTPSGYTTGKIHLFQFRRPQSTGADQWIGSFILNS
ncbi:hypothetical protein [Comamonas serinivorans]|uniref:hypothetical protein n=1 Tax=Comamonas serinivorans TaxID=1082851 RepID=UPI0012FC3987|nr:hypothetical protein [Comamonas serinivorans]